jgi:tRNA pseudouridine32 synthase / 23S rRNA pseudouridine746 synthase
MIALSLLRVHILTSTVTFSSCSHVYVPFLLLLWSQDIKVVFEDDHVIVVNKPTGVLCVGGADGHPNLADAVCDSFPCELGSNSNNMVVHRLGMDTSGLVVFAKTLQAVRGMNSIFRSRKIERTYEALVCGHIEKDEGMINLPLMRDYEFPPFMRISTDAHQRALVDLDEEQVGKKLLEAPKESLTKYQVIAREEMEGNPVTRVTLTSITGRTHQLNVHMAAFGHPLVGDTTYGINGDAAPNGGLSASELVALAPNAARADASLQQAITRAAKTKCVHAKSLKFRHPVTKEDVSLSVAAPF